MRGLAIPLLVLVVSGTALGQAGFPAKLPDIPIPSPTAGPGSNGWPALAPPTQPSSPSAPPPAPSVLEAVPTPFPATLETGPIPGGVADTYNREVAARNGFRYCTWHGSTITALPQDLLWQPPYASPREARMLLMPSTHPNYKGPWSLETSIGTTVGFFRYEPAGSDLAFQFDIFGVVHSRLSPEDVMSSDYRFGFPLSVRWESWHAKVAYEHTSAHLGDRVTLATNRMAFIQARDETVFALGRWVTDELRLYGEVAYAFFHKVPGSTDPYRFDVGFEWYKRAATGWAGTPFVAANADFQGDLGYNPNLTVQAGWLWRNPYQRLGNIRLFAEYFNGHSRYGQFFKDREVFYAGGLSCDY